MNFSRLFERASQSLRTPLGERLVVWLQRLFLTAVLIWLFVELSSIGWKTLWHSLPGLPLFYLLLLIAWLQLPIVEILIYRISWNFPVLRSMPAFLLKRIYNSTLLGYSGELYFYTWARQLPGQSDRNVFLTIKDNNILSSIASTLVVFGLILIFLLSGQLKLLEWVASQGQSWFWSGLAGTILITSLLIYFRHSIITMPMRAAGRIFSIQIVRLLLLQAINVWIYYTVIPEAPLQVWFTLISVEMILSRIPFLPNRDLLFIGLSIGLAEVLVISQAEIAGLMVARTLFNKLAGFLLAGLFIWPFKGLVEQPGRTARTNRSVQRP